MEELTTLQIIVKDSPQTMNKNNMNLFKFLNLNYQEIVQSGYYIRLTLLTKNNCRSIPSTIKNTPALINSDDNHIEMGTYNIINYLITMCEGAPYNEDTQSAVKSEPENKDSQFTNSFNTTDIRDFLMSEALSPDTIEDPIDLNRVKDKENLYKIRQEQQKSTNSKFNNSMIQTFKNNINHRNTSIDNLPKDEKNMYDNRELTETRPVSEYMSDDKDLEKFWQNMEETKY